MRAGKYIETGLVTAGDDLTGVARFLAPGARDYSASDVVAAPLPAWAAAPRRDGGITRFARGVAPVHRRAGPPWPAARASW